MKAKVNFIPCRFCKEKKNLGYSTTVNVTIRVDPGKKGKGKGKKKNKPEIKIEKEHGPVSVCCMNCGATGPTAKTFGWATRKWNKK